MRVIELTGPGDADFVATARLVATSIGTQAGLTVDGCDELRLAVDEACRALVHAGSPTLLVAFVIERAITVTVRSGKPQQVNLAPTSRLVLHTLTDNVSLDDQDGEIRLVKFVH
jgi:anti-sigma regulatory factor (Ser/Thr protein kinase)